MESAGLRQRQRAARQATNPIIGHEPPRFTVNLSVAPEHRYDHIIPHVMDAITDANVAAQFDELIDMALPDMPFVQKCLHMFARMALRRVHGDEETAELRGIARATGISMHLLVALNVVLDLLLGCTSGGVRYKEGSDAQARIVHFRTLDWGMDPLRNLIVELDYVQRETGPVIATTVGYIGYVGVLTGVRHGLSMSLNFRPHHDRTTRRRRLAFRYHQLMVLLGRRPSISSALRRYLLPPAEMRKIARWREKTPKPKEPPGIEAILDELSTSRSTAAYLIFGTPQRLYSVEKDHKSCSVASDEHFLVTCNHDLADEKTPGAIHEAARNVAPESGMDFLVDDSLDRKETVRGDWKKNVKKATRRGKQRDVKADEPAMGDGIKMKDVLGMLARENISNEMTHYAVVMDPERGKVMWRRAYQAGELGGGTSSSEDD
jgi:hypothetical protein